VLVRRDVRPRGLRPVRTEPDTGTVVRILERRRVQMVVGADGRSRRLTGTETGVMELKRA